MSATEKKKGLAGFFRVFQSQQMGLILVILVLGTVLTLRAGTHIDPTTGLEVNNFMNPATLIETAKDASLFAIMAVGMTLVIITTGIDLSVGSIYALASVVGALVLRHMTNSPGWEIVLVAFAVLLGVGFLCGLINGEMVVWLKLHPFIITLGTMLVLRGIAFVATKAESILVPDALISFVKFSFGLGETIKPIPMLIMILVMIVGAIYLTQMVAGRHVFAVGGNEEASRYSGLRINRILASVYAISGLTCGIAAFVGMSYYGSASCNDATGYELYVIASAVVGGASLSGGKGSAFGAMLGAVLITLIRRSISILHFDQNYEQIIVGMAIIIAVVLDQVSARISARRLVQSRVADAAAEPTKA